MWKIERLYNDSILLIGPSGAGKSTVAEILSRMTNLQRLSLDRIANHDRATGFGRRFRNADEYNLFMISRVLERAEQAGVPGIVDFGAGHSVYDSEEIFADIKRKVGKFRNVVLLLPSHDLEKSLQILASRSTGDYSTNRKFMTSPCNSELATITVYEDGRTPVEIAEEIIRKIESRNVEEKDGEER